MPERTSPVDDDPHATERIAALAESEGLGAHVGTYLWTTLRLPWSRYLVGAVSLGVVTALLFAVGPLTGAIATGLCVLVLVGPIALRARARVRHVRAGSRLELYENGLIAIGAGTASRVVQYSDTTVFVTIRSVVWMTTGETEYSRYRYRLTDTAGRELTLADLSGTHMWIPGGYAGGPEWGAAIGRGIVARRFATALADLDQGLELDFGPIRVSAQYLAQGKRLTPWSEILAIEIDNGNVRVVAGKSGGKRKPVAYSPIPLIANYHLWYALAEHLRQRSSTSTR
ncbi:hypothetical protein OHB26_24670 [Nocardia sp. NBC_01503]|uniref:DUF6585 family protein n=1 Tax=Nocardia sp. NBC_01503 TaxID=2975997 RepID=UPI002E7B9F11|nr:DUF6585 family protein [Nocardia sp. NBC_01503]WTL30134.1 hypothetical protein OHB26_24670 [Nocardia sp. NBC_01503]